MLKTFLTPLILFSALLLTACGGGGGGGTAATSGGGITPTPTPIDPPSAVVNSAIASGGNSFDDVALRNAYTADTSNGFLMFLAADDGPFNGGSSENYYTAASSLPSSSGAIIQNEYRVANNNVMNAFSFSYGTPIATGVQVTLVEDSTPANQIIIETVDSDTFKRVGQSNIDFTGYSVYVYQGTYAETVTTGTNAAPVTMTNTNTKNVPFIAATYAALIYRPNFRLYETNSLNNFGNSRAYTYGQLTPTSALPASGEVSYNLVAMGSYSSGAANGAGSKVLVGTGRLTADFTRDPTANPIDYPLVDLNLDINDLSGNDFVNITVNNLRIADDVTGNFINEFYVSGRVNTQVVTDYATGTGLTDSTAIGTSLIGHFFGPNAEEVGGGLCNPCGTATLGPDNDSSVDDFLSIGFIGKRQ